MSRVLLSLPWSVLAALLSYAAVGSAATTDGDWEEATVCSMGWGLHALTLFVQFWLLDLVSLDRNSWPSRGLAYLGRWASALGSAVWGSVKGACTCRAVRFTDLLNEARVEEEKHLDGQCIVNKGVDYLEERNVDWMAMSLPGEARSDSVRLYFIAGMFSDGKRVEGSVAKSHSVFLDGQVQDVQVYLNVTLRGTKRRNCVFLHAVMTVNVLMAASNMIGALLWLVKLPNIVGAAYATSRMGMKAVGLGIFQWAATRLPDGFYLLEGPDLESVQSRCQYLKTKHIWNLSDLCSECIEGGRSTWWLIDTEGYDGSKCGIVRGGVFWSRAPRPVEVVYNYPYCIPAGCAIVGYAVFVWPYCWIAALLIVMLLIGDHMLEQTTASILPLKIAVVISALALIMFYDIFIIAAGLLYTGVPYWDAVKKSYAVGDTECALMDRFTTIAESLTLL